MIFFIFIFLEVLARFTGSWHRKKGGYNGQYFQSYIWESYISGQAWCNIDSWLLFATVVFPPTTSAQVCLSTLQFVVLL